jgi:hypothetical protein
MQNLKSAYFLAFIVLVAILFGYTCSRPSYNWDLLLYTSAVISVDETNPQVIHDRTYQIAQASMPAQAYKILVTGENEEESYRNPEVFQSLKPLTKTRPLYIFLLILLNKIGLNPVFATVLLSSAGCFLFALSCFIWLAKYYSGMQSFFLSLVIIYLGRFTTLAKMATPEALSAAVMLAAVYLIVEKRKYIPAYLLFAAAIGLRYDNVVFPMAVLLPQFIFRREESGISKALLSGGVVLLGGVFIVILIFAAENPLHYLSSQLFLGAFTQSNAAQQSNSYGAAMNRFLLDLRLAPSRILVFLIPIAGYSVLGRISKELYSFNVLFWGTVATLFIRIILFPSIEIRFYVFYLALICMLFLLELGKMTQVKARIAVK